MTLGSTAAARGAVPVSIPRYPPVLRPVSILRRSRNVLADRRLDPWTAYGTQHRKPGNGHLIARGHPDQRAVGEERELATPGSSLHGVREAQRRIFTADPRVHIRQRCACAPGGRSPSNTRSFLFGWLSCGYGRATRAVARSEGLGDKGDPPIWDASIGIAQGWHVHAHAILRRSQPSIPCGKAVLSRPSRRTALTRHGGRLRQGHRLRGSCALGPRMIEWLRVAGVRGRSRPLSRLQECL